MKRIFQILFSLILFTACTHEITPNQLEEGPRKIDPNAVITGTVKVKEGLVPKGTGTLFVIARPKGQIAGRPLAVTRIEDPVFPIGFRLSQDNVMIPTERFEGEVTLMAKWSKAGAPMTATPGDLSTSQGVDLAVGKKDVELVLDKME